MTTLHRHGWAVTPVASGRERAGRLLAERVTRLLEHGVRTLPVSFDAHRRALVRPWREAEDGRAILRRVQADDEEVRMLIAGCLQVLSPLHRIPPEALNLTRFDPFARIRPRLDRATPHPTTSRACSLVVRLAAALSEAAPDHAVHGDFHPGQLLFGSARELPWLTDFEDLAAGEPEADLGNLVAYLTTFPLSEPPAGMRYRRIESMVRSEAHACGIRCRTPHLRRYAAAALLRRGLKARERGHPDAVTEAALTLAERLVEEAPVS